VQWCAVWESDKKDFMGIIILRDLLEMLVFFVEALKETFARDEISGDRTKDKVTEAEFVASFLETYLGVIIDQNHVRNRSRSFRKRSDSGTRHMDVDSH